MTESEFDFDSRIDRRGTMSYKWDGEPDRDVIPMWVADMDFRTAPCIVDALRKRVDHGVFGYTRVPDEYYDALINWFDRQHHWRINRSDVIYTSGVVPAISATIKALCRPGEKVLVQTPVYNCFFSSIRNNGCLPAEAPLTYSPTDGYRIDFEKLETTAADPAVTMMLVCNPHNPGGRVWTREELEKVAAICRRNHVRIVSDEIHCELTFDGHRYTPMATVAPEAIVFVSPSKSFNTAGLQIANIIAPGDEVRAAIDKAININEVCDVNPFGVTALIAAYNEGEPWLEALKRYLWENYLTVRDFLRERLPALSMPKLEGTYLLWIDIRQLGLTSEQAADIVMRRGHLHINPGTMYGSAGEGFIRLNIACPRSTLLEGLRRLEAALGSEALI